MSYLGPIEIPKRSAHCFDQKEPLTAGMDYVSVILNDESGEKFIRQDFCLPCWQKKEKQGLSSTYKSFWKGKVPPSKAEKQVPFHPDQLLEWLRQALQDSTPAGQARAFVLALFLTRKKQLFLRQEVKVQSKPALLFEVAETEEMLTVQKIDLTITQIASIQQELTEELKKLGAK